MSSLILGSTRWADSRPNLRIKISWPRDRKTWGRMRPQAPTIRKKSWLSQSPTAWLKLTKTWGAIKNTNVSRRLYDRECLLFTFFTSLVAVLVLLSGVCSSTKVSIPDCCHFRNTDFFSFFALFFPLHQRSRHQVASVFRSRTESLGISDDILFLVNWTPCGDKVDLGKKRQWFSSFHCSSLI